MTLNGEQRCMSDEQKNPEIEQEKTAKPAGAVYEHELTPHKAGKPIALGFCIGTAYFIYAVVNGTVTNIDITQLLMQLTAVAGIGILAHMAFKGWMGKRWSNQHRFEKTLQLIIDTTQGIWLSIIAFGVYDLFS